jgi:signal transduction histidine kinase
MLETAKKRTTSAVRLPKFSTGNPAKKLLAHLVRSVEQSVQYSTPKFVAIGALAVVGFPLYYWIWAILFPQPYENLPLRIFGSFLFVPLMLAPYWPNRLRRYLAAYWYVAITFALPFFFNFMLLKNQGSLAWLMSMLVCVFLMILLLDWLNLIVMMCVGSALAWLANWATGGSLELPIFYAANLPIFLFALVAGALVTFTQEMVAQEKLGTMLTAASNIAHELRTPLLGIKSGAVGLKRYLPMLIEGYNLAKERGLPVQSMRAGHYESMLTVLDRIHAEVDRSNTVIDMLLMNATQTNLSQTPLTYCSMADCVDSALDRYPFSTDDERDRVVWERSVDFRFLGSDPLMIHLLFNFLKNALQAIARARKGDIQIWLVPGKHHNEVHFRDSGLGIPATVMPRIFTRFYSWSGSTEGDVGTGVGLAFCKSVVECFGGTITCRSILNESTEFVVALPNVSPQ